MNYTKAELLNEELRVNVFRHFTNACGKKTSIEFADILYSKFTVEDSCYSDDLCYNSILNYFKNKVIPHKIAVYEAGLSFLDNEKVDYLFENNSFKEEFIRNLWLHDMSKFSANEAFGYAMHDFKNPNRESVEAFESAWHHHKMNNPHHPEYWLNPNRSGVLEPLPMPNIYILEMIADWMGASKTYGSTLAAWLPANISKFKFRNRSKVAELIRDCTGINVVLGEEGCLVLDYGVARVGQRKYFNKITETLVAKTTATPISSYDLDLLMKLVKPKEIYHADWSTRMPFLIITEYTEDGFYMYCNSWADRTPQLYTSEKLHSYLNYQGLAHCYIL